MWYQNSTIENERWAPWSNGLPAEVATAHVMRYAWALQFVEGKRVVDLGSGAGYGAFMLSWQAGPKPYDGVWAPHWYNAVWQSEGFNQPPSHNVELDAAHQNIADDARPYYDRLKAHKL